MVFKRLPLFRISLNKNSVMIKIYTLKKNQNYIFQREVGICVLDTIERKHFYKNKSKLIKSLNYFLLTFLMILFTNSIKSQNIFSINFSDTSTYHTTCGSVNNAQWSVRNDSCMCYSPYYRMETLGCSNIDYNYKVNQSGSGTIKDIIYIQYQLNAGLWITDTIIYGKDYNSVHSISSSINICYGTVIRMRIIMVTSSKSDFWSIKNGDETITGNFVTYSTYPKPLPIELSSLKAKCTTTGSIISWTTSSEIKNDYFTVEKSTDLNHWEILTTIPGSLYSNTELSYSVEDKSVNSGQLIYYRLRQTDIDGQFKYFNIISRICNSESSFQVIGINSFDQQLNITFNTDVTELVTIEVYDISGNMKFKQNQMSVIGENMISTDYINLNSGIHMIALTQEGNRVTKKIMVN